MNSEFPHVRGLAHDIRCILAVQRLAAEQLERHDDARVRIQALRIQRAIDGMADACKSTLDRTKAWPGCPGRVVVSPLDAIDDVLDALAGSVPPNLDIRVDARDDMVIVTDRSALYRILLNLIDNAIKATSDGTPHSLTITLSAVKGTCHVQICDDGAGLDRETRRWLVHQRPLRWGRSGTGLFTALHLANLIGAELSLVATGARGTSFSLQLPMGGAAPVMLLADAVTGSTNNVHVDTWRAPDKPAHSAAAP